MVATALAAARGGKRVDQPYRETGRETGREKKRKKERRRCTKLHNFDKEASCLCVRGRGGQEDTQRGLRAKRELRGGGGTGRRRKKEKFRKVVRWDEEEKRKNEEEEVRKKYSIHMRHEMARKRLGRR